MGHAGGEPPDAGQLLALHQPVLVLGERGGHGVELARQRAELVGRVHVDAGVEAAGGEAGRPLLESRDGPGDGAADVEAHRPAEQGRAEEQGQDPRLGAPLHRLDLGTGRGDGALRAGHQGLGQVLDAGHDELGAVVLPLHEGPVAPDHGRDDPLAEDDVELAAGLLDVVDRREGLGELELRRSCRVSSSTRRCASE